MIFEIEEISHPLYSRNGDDLIYKASLTLAEAIKCDPVELKTLDNRKIRIALDEIPKYLYANLALSC